MTRVVLAVCTMMFLTRMTVPAVAFTNLYEFRVDTFNGGSPDVETNGDGLNPAGFVLAGNVLYGTTSGGGLYGDGTIFRVNTDGSGFTNLFNFNNGPYDPVTSSYPASTGSDPVAGLILISNSLYGTTFEGGALTAGTVFKIDTNGQNFTQIFSFSFTNGQGPSSGLTWHSNRLYGTTAGGGTNGYGTVFSVGLDTQSFASEYQFQNPTQPYGNVVVVSNNWYGFGHYGGAASDGYVFRVGPAGFADLFDFTGVNGASPYSGPLASGGTLFGLTYQGGTNGAGTIFRINIDGKAYTNLYGFSPASGANTDGAHRRHRIYRVAFFFVRGRHPTGSADPGEWQALRHDHLWHPGGLSRQRRHFFIGFGTDAHNCRGRPARGAYVGRSVVHSLLRIDA
jgi:uncharacterized repeat protein (TIGR03803 family)